MKMNRSNIQEANKHLHALHQRVEDLERAVKEQNELLASKDYFIQNKIKELSAQDMIIQEIQHRLQVKDHELQERNSIIERLTAELSEKNLENATLQEKAKFLNKILECIPDLKKVVTQMDGIASRVKGNQDYGYIEVSGSSSTAEDGDDTNTTNFNTSELIVKSKLKDGEQMDSELTNGAESVGEMARHFAKDGRMHKFSVSEDDVNSEEETLTNQPPMGGKELYF